MNRVVATVALCGSLIALGGCGVQSPEQTEPTNILYDIWGPDADNVWAVGARGLVLRKDGTGWRKESSGTTQHVAAIWGTDKSHVFAVGQQGTVLKFDGTSWQPFPIDPGKVRCSGSGDAPVNLYGIWGSGLQDIWVVGDCGALLHFDGNGWTRQAALSDPADPKSAPILEQIVGVWGTGVNDVYAVGWKETLLHFDGTTWAPERWNWNTATKITEPNPAAPVKTRAEWEKADRCTIHPGQPESFFPYINFFRVSGSGPNDVFAIGSCGTVLYRDPVTKTWDVPWRASSFDGKTLQPLARFTKNGLNAVYVSGTSTWLVGDRGGLFSRSSPQSWSSRASDTTTDLSGVFVDSQKQMWITAYDDKIRQFTVP